MTVDQPKRLRRHVSDVFALGRKQPSLDFVDVNVDGDVRVFIDPRALRLLPSEWGSECVSLVQSFFGTVLRFIRQGRHDEAQQLLRALREPNETHLGFSKGRSRGRALGGESARDVWEALRSSEAVVSGLLEDLEDTILMVPGVSSDIVSDIASNIIRGPLIRYTQDAARYYGLPLASEVASGPMWDPGARRWFQDLVPLPVVEDRRLVLVPKVIVRRRMDYDEDEYFNDYILEELRDQELAANTELVRVLKDGRRRVTAKDLVAKYGHGKLVIVRHTLANPRLLREYREDKRRAPRPPMTHAAIADSADGDTPDWTSLLEGVTSVPAGRDQAAEYERAIEMLLSPLFYPGLVTPTVQHEIHDGRKRIDITYVNVAKEGFFGWLAQHYPASHVFMECKNYSTDIGNPALDQMSGRFSPSRGRFGIIVCRKFEEKELFMQRCRDTASDDRGFIIPIDDADLSRLIEERMRDDLVLDFPILKERFDRLIM